MAFLDRFTKKPMAPKTPASLKKAAEEAPSTKDASNASASATGGIAKAHAFTLLKPHVSEKAARLADKGIYVFDVPVTANKVEIRKAVESQYKVNVTDVRTIRGIGKPVLRGRIAGRRNRWKKAMVELKKGQAITLVESV